MKNWFITGVSRGIGKALAEAALARGDTVVGTVREGKPQIASGKGTFHCLTLEMRDPKAIESTVLRAFELAGSLDVVVNNAGYGLLSPVEEVSDVEMARLFEVNVFGPMRVIRAVLPRLRAQRSGHIINISTGGNYHFIQSALAASGCGAEIEASSLEHPSPLNPVRSRNGCPQ